MNKTVGLTIRENIIDRIHEKINESSVYFFVGFNKVSSSALSELRNKLRLEDSYLFVAKNSLIRKAFEDKKLDELKDYLNDETGIIFAYSSDIVSSCKVLVEFSKENESFILKGGVIESQKITREDLEALAKLPSREVLLGQAVSGLASPLVGFLACLNQVILKFIWLADEIKKVRGSQAEGKEKEAENKEAAKPEEKKDQAESKKEEENKGAEPKKESDDKGQEDSKEGKEKE